MPEQECQGAWSQLCLAGTPSCLRTAKPCQVDTIAITVIKQHPWEQQTYTDTWLSNVSLRHTVLSYSKTLQVSSTLETAKQWNRAEVHFQCWARFITYAPFLLSLSQCFIMKSKPLLSANECQWERERHTSRLSKAHSELKIALLLFDATLAPINRPQAIRKETMHFSGLSQTPIEATSMIQCLH